MVSFATVNKIEVTENAVARLAYTLYLLCL